MHQIHPHPNHFIQFGKPKEDYLCLSSLAWHSSFIQQAGYLPLLQHKLKSSRLNSSRFFTADGIRWVGDGPWTINERAWRCGKETLMIRFEPERCMKNNEGHNDERGKKKDATQRLTAYLYKHCTQIRKCKQTYSIR